MNIVGNVTFELAAPPSAADITASLAATPSFVSAVAAAIMAEVAAQTPPPVVVPPPVVTGTAPVLKMVMAQNGVTPNLPQDYSYVATDLHNDAVDGGDGNPMCIKVTVTAPWGGFQPSSNNGASLDFSKCSQLVVSIKSPAAGIPYSMQFLKAGDQPIPGSGVAFTSTKANVWERFSFNKALLMTDHSNPTATVDVSNAIYKGAVQMKSGQPGGFLIDNWGGI